MTVVKTARIRKEKGFFIDELVELAQRFKKMKLQTHRTPVAMSYGWALETAEIPKWILEEHEKYCREEFLKNFDKLEQKEENK